MYHLKLSVCFPPFELFKKNLFTIIMTQFIISNLAKAFIFITGVPSAVSPAKKRPSLSSGSPNSSTGSESPSQLLIQSSQSDSSGYETSSILSTSDQPSSQTSSSGQSQQQSQQKPILRQIMVGISDFALTNSTRYVSHFLKMFPL